MPDRSGLLATATAHRPIDGCGFAPLDTPFEPGAAPMLQWLKIADLVVDDSYQRPVVGAGRSNVRRIARDFSWSKFAPVIVAPVEGGRYAIIDGQHRATAAAMRGVESVPCQIVIADRREQAAAFGAINGQVTAISALALHHAALSAGEASAVAIDNLVAEAGVTLLRYQRPADKLRPGETIALGTIRRALGAYEQEVVVTALKCVTSTSNNVPGALSAAVIHALVETLAGNARWCRGGGVRLLRAFDGISLEEELDEAKVTRRPKLTPIWEILADRLRARLRELTDAGAL